MSLGKFKIHSNAQIQTGTLPLQLSSFNLGCGWILVLFFKLASLTGTSSMY